MIPDDLINDPMSSATDALWNSIDNSNYTAGYFATTYRLDAEGPRDVDEFMVPESPTLPAIEILGEKLDADWKTHRIQDEHCTFRIRIWTAEWVSKTAYKAAERVRRAVWGCPPIGSMHTDLVQQTLGYLPLSVTPTTYKRIMLRGPQGTRAFQIDMIVALRTQHDPIDPNS